ncbi:hypothetical protein AC481_05475 [miscellaneous Crenarchaeota group archaeon SMTZ-80]|nr:MAG: hypothetical protein AC481_05475 [miscellaneous Crenarchaeota group archaeon SMTZ-80]
MKKAQSIFFSKDSELKLRSFLKRKGKTVIIGLGNIYKMDDAAGIAALRLLRKKNLDKVKDVSLIEAGRRLIDYVHVIGDLKPTKIIFIDSSSFGADPGRTKLFSQDQISDGNLNTHENNFNLVLGYLKKKIPDSQILFIGIQFGCLDMTDEVLLTENVRKGVGEIVRSFEKYFQ